jgi:hypothetical protein
MGVQRGAQAQKTWISGLLWRWIRTFGTAAQKPWISAAFRAWRGIDGLLNGTA